MVLVLAGVVDAVALAIGAIARRLTIGGGCARRGEVGDPVFVPEDVEQDVVVRIDQSWGDDAVGIDDGRPLGSALVLAIRSGSDTGDSVTFHENLAVEEGIGGNDGAEEQEAVGGPDLNGGIGTGGSASARAARGSARTARGSTRTARGSTRTARGSTRTAGTRFASDATAACLSRGPPRRGRLFRLRIRGACGQHGSRQKDHPCPRKSPWRTRITDHERKRSPNSTDAPRKTTDSTRRSPSPISGSSGYLVAGCCT